MLKALSVKATVSEYHTRSGRRASGFVVAFVKANMAQLKPKLDAANGLGTGK